MEFDVEPGYEAVADVLQQALNQTQKGKGKDRHATDERFEDQKIMHGARTCGLGGMSFQVYKKATEAQRQAEEGNFQGARANLKGAIIYAAAQFLRTKELEKEKLSKDQEEVCERANRIAQCISFRCEKCGNFFYGDGVKTSTGLRCMICSLMDNSFRD